MPTSALALAGVIAIRPAEGAEATSRADVEHSATIVPLLTMANRRPSAYGHGNYPARLMALAITAAIHVIIVAVLVLELRKPETPAQSHDAIVVTLLPLSPDRPAKRADRGIAAKKMPPKTALAELPPPILDLHQQSPIAATEPTSEPPAPADSGKEDRIGQATREYQRALLARLESERRYPRGALLDGYQGLGAVVLHVDRQGHLLDAVIEASTGSRALDRAALVLVRRATPYPAIPAELPDLLAITVPIEFLIVEPGARVASR